MALRRTFRVHLGLLAFGIGLAGPGAAQPALDPANLARFKGETVSPDARTTVDWVTASHDNHALPFVVIDKVNAKVFAFDAAGVLRGTAPALLGMAIGDDSVPGIANASLKRSRRTNGPRLLVVSRHPSARISNRISCGSTMTPRFPCIA